MARVWRAGAAKLATSALLACGLAVSGALVAPAQAATITSGCLTFDVSETEATLTDGSTCTGAIVIPATVSTKPVTTINAYSFRYAALRSVSIPASVTSVGQHAFSDCANLTKATFVTAGSTLGSIPDFLFENDPLTSLTMPNSITTIGRAAFRGTSLTGVSLPTNLSVIRDYAFADATHLAFVALPSALLSIGDGAFTGTSLVSLSIPSSVTDIGYEAFRDVTTLTDVNFPDSGLGTLNIGDSAFQGTSIGQDLDGTLILTPAVSYIGSSAFRDIASLTNVVLPDTGYVAIGSYAFVGTGLTALDITPAVTVIGPHAFSQLTSLTDLTLPETGAFAIGEAAFAGTGLAGTLTITPAVTSVGRSSFQSTTDLTSVVFPDTGSMGIGVRAFHSSGLTSLTLGDAVTSIGENAFERTSLAAVSVPASVETIGESAFLGVDTLTSLTLASPGVTAIGDFAFAHTSVGSVALPGSLETLGAAAFAGSPNLTAFTINGASSDFAVSGGVLFDHTSTHLVAYPSGRVGSYVVPAAAEVAPWAFAYASGLTTVAYAAGSHAASVPDYAFLGSGLTAIALPATVTDLGVQSLSQTRLTSITLPAAVVAVQDGAFRDTEGLSTVRFLGDAPSFGSDVFTGSGMGTVYYYPSMDGWPAALATDLTGYSQVRMIAPTYGLGRGEDLPAKIAGAARINRKLTARAGTWGSDVDTSVSYSWYACKKAVGHVSASLPGSAGCRSIAGQHASTFKIAKKYKRTYILAGVTVSNEFGSTTRFTRTTLRVR